MTRPRVLVVADYYLPGFRAGGPVRAISNTIRRLSSDADFSVVTRDHDADGSRYRDVEAGRWTDGAAGRVLYAPRLTPALLQRCVADTACDVIWLNSFFSRASIGVLALRRIGRIRRPVLLAPRGEFSPGALALKRRRKAIAIRLLRWTGCLRSIHWLASSDAERRTSPAPSAPRRSPACRRASRRCPRPTSNGRQSRIDASGPCSPHGSRRRRTCISCWRSWRAATATFTSTSSARSRIRITGPGAAALMQRLPATVTVDYTGEATHHDLQRRLSTYDVMILPTLGENFGHVIVEAWAAGCPVLVSDRTPWRQLTARGLGWDVSLDHRAWTSAIDECLDMSPEAHSGDATTRPGTGAARLAGGRRRRRLTAAVDRRGRAATGVVHSRSRSRARDGRRQRHRPMRVGIVAPDLREPGGVREKALFVARSLTGPARRLGADRVARDLSQRRLEHSAAPAADVAATARLALPRRGVHRGPRRRGGS